MNIEENAMLDTKKLADLLCVKVQTIRKWLKDKRIPQPDLWIGQKRKEPRWHQRTIHKMLNEGKI